MKITGSPIGMVLASLLLIGPTSSKSASQTVCTALSSIDGVPFFVGQTYSDLLGRVPDNNGQQYYIGSLENSNASNCSSQDPTLAATSCEWINNAQTVMSFLGSSESIAKNGTLSDNSAFVIALYNLLLRRAPDTPGLNYYELLLESGTSRLAVISKFLASTEYRRRFACTFNGNNPPACNGVEAVDPVPSFVSQSYSDLLNRLPDTPGDAYWNTYMASAQTAMCRNFSLSAFSACDRVLESQMTLNFLDSAEYQRSNPSISQSADFVTALYEHLLQRQPDQTGLQFYTNYVNQSNDRLGTIYAFLTSSEYRSRFGCYAGNRNQMNFGINGHPLSGVEYDNSAGVDFTTQMNLIKGAGLSWYRVDVGAPSSGGDYSQMDLLLSTAQAAGIQLLPIIIPVVNRETDSLSEMFTESYEGAYALVSRYKTSIHAWELSNEEDVYSIYAYGDPWNGGSWPWGNPSGNTTSDFYPPRVAISEAILQGLAEGVRAADPAAVRLINFAWVHTGFIQLIESAGVPYDVVAMHWYSNTDVATETGMGDVTCPGQNLPCPAQAQFPNVVDQVHMITNGKPLWITEVNYQPVAANSVPTNIAWEESYLPVVLQTYLGSPPTYPFEVVLIYELLDQPDISQSVFSQVGLYEDTLTNGYTTLGAPKPAYLSVQQMLTNQ